MKSEAEPPLPIKEQGEDICITMKASPPMMTGMFTASADGPALRSHFPVEDITTIFLA
ncbi:hypothetical protein BBO01nite_25690 [Brevibacillus borstelensis]|nr:hypothetical protein BBO01nite_25690 [Brevibacillus borstelensis]